MFGYSFEDYSGSTPFHGSSTVATRNAGGGVIEGVTGETGWAPSVAEDALQRIHVAFASLTGSGWVRDSVATTTPRPSLAIDVGHTPHTAYMNRATGALELAERVGTPWTSALVSTDQAPYIAPSLALDPAGRPRISYAAAAAFGQYLRWAQRDGGPWILETIIGDPGPGDVPSLGFDASGRAGVSHHQVPADILLAATKPTPVRVPPLTLTPTPGLRILGANPRRAGEGLSVQLTLSAPDDVMLKLFDARGRQVAMRGSASLVIGSATIEWALPPLAAGG